MVNFVSSAVRALTTISDLVRVIESTEKMFQARQWGHGALLEEACVMNRLACLGFTITEIGMLIGGAKSNALIALKELESIPRTLELPISLCIEISDADMSIRGIFKVFEKGFISPMADICRFSAQCRAYNEQRFLEMTPEEVKNAKRPVYETRKFGSETESVLVGYKPVDLDECKENREFAQKEIVATTMIRTLAENGTLETAVCDIGIPLYERLANFLRLDLHPVPAARPVVAGILVEQHLNDALLDLNFQNYPRIPLPLHDDEVFRRFICPITQDPIRDPVRDPTNNRTLYERSAIINWLRFHSQSPVTRQLLRSEDLIDAVALKAVIDQRLEYHRRGLLDYLRVHQNDPVSAADRAVINEYE